MNLWKNLGTKLNFNLAYHSQLNGKTEVVNRSFRNLLRILVGGHPKQWDCVLDRIDFTYNESQNRRTRKSLFQILYGMHPRRVCDLKDLGKL